MVLRRSAPFQVKTAKTTTMSVDQNATTLSRSSTPCSSLSSWPSGSYTPASFSSEERKRSFTDFSDISSEGNNPAYYDWDSSSEDNVAATSSCATLNQIPVKVSSVKHMECTNAPCALSGCASSSSEEEWTTDETGDFLIRLPSSKYISKQQQQQQKQTVPRVDYTRAGVMQSQLSNYNQVPSVPPFSPSPVLNVGTALADCDVRNNDAARTLKSSVLPGYPRVIAPMPTMSAEERFSAKAHPFQNEMLYEQCTYTSSAPLKLPAGLQPWQIDAIKKAFDDETKRKSVAAVTRALLTRRGIQPSLAPTKLGLFLSSISKDFNARAAQQNPDENKRDGDNIESSLCWAIFKEERYGSFDFVHAKSSAEIADKANKRTMPPPPPPPPAIVSSSPSSSGSTSASSSRSDSYARSWMKLDSFFPVFDQDEWGALYLADLLVWVS